MILFEKQFCLCCYRTTHLFYCMAILTLLHGHVRFGSAVKMPLNKSRNLNVQGVPKKGSMFEHDYK